MAGTIAFPSTAWFERLAALMRDDEAAFRALGPIDCTMVVKVNHGAERAALHELSFEGYGVKSIRALASLEQAVAHHFVIEGPHEAWREMVENIRAHGGADLEHTLNYLTLPDDPLRVDGPDQLETDAFYRYNQTLQRFFEGAARIDTSFPGSRSTQPVRKVA
jgi:hypothetical protein